MNLTLMELAANIILIWGQNHVNRGYEEDTLSDHRDSKDSIKD